MLFINSEVAGLFSSILSSPLIFIALIICSAYVFSVGRRILFHSFTTRLCLAVIILLSSGFAQGQNAIVNENLLPGNPISEWGVNTSADFRNVNLNGFATDISVNKGSTVHFKIDGLNGVSYSIKIYRLGYYGGMGASLKADLGSFPGIKQPAGIADLVTGMVDCSNWAESASWNVPATAVSGFYVVKLQNTNNDINNIVFIVRDDASNSQMLFQANDATWQAYNAYGGSNLYNGTTSLNQGHASKVSYNRPFFIYNAGFLTNGLGSDWYMNDAYPMIRFMERNGYDMSYTTNTDIAQATGTYLTSHKVLVAAGHDEYWSKEMRDNVENARAAGVNLAFFTGNEVYWKTRWENDVNGKANRVLVCYKEGTLADGSTGEATCGSKCDVSSPVWTGLWRMGGNYDAGKPENSLTGTISWDPSNTAIKVPYAYKDLRFWRYTSIPSLTAGQIATLAPSSLGYEFDFEQYPTFYPHGRITMSSTTVGVNTHKLSLYKDPSGAWVFGAGTVLWAWGLDDQHFGGPNTVSADMQQATINLFTDMHVNAGSIQSGLALGTPSTDVTAPASIITSPANNATLPISSQITISGTAADVGGAVGGVEVSVDGGTTWLAAVGTTNWTYSWNPALDGVYVIKSRAFDDSGNMEDGTVSSGPNVVNVTLLPPACPCHLFTTQTPVDNLENDQTGIEVGVKFKSSENGFITGIRFYKTTGNIGEHIGELYSKNGTLLASAIFSGETTNGWQTVNFPNPVAVKAGTTYVASYFSQSGNYFGTSNYFTTDINNSPLTGLADNFPSDPNGVYVHTSAPAFPTLSPGNKSNYWVDVTFNTTSTAIAVAGPDQTISAPATTATLNGNGSTGTITDYTWTNISGPNTAGITTPNAVSTTVTGLIPGTYIFLLSVNSGISTSQVSVNVLASGAPSTIFTTQFPTDALSSGLPVELGVKFRSSQAGYINGIRFYKTMDNDGAHIGELYSTTGAKLASATFNGETTSGWQTVLFSTPVQITANTTYIAAYFSAAGTFTSTANYFTTPVVNSPLTGLADGTDGPNGVFIYNNSPAEPTNGANQTNYWVDAIYSSVFTPIVAKAGNDQTIILLVATATLDGSTSINATSYLWTQISGPNTATITAPTGITTNVSGLEAGTYVFQLSINGGVSTAQVSVTVLPVGSTLTIFTTQTPPDNLTNNDANGKGIELGVKFRSSQDGYISGVRFFKTTGNLGTHVGELYASNGTRLATATFSSETASGWQTVNFSTPVAITANTTYIATYFSSLGNYKGTVNYFTTAVVNSPLTGLADGTDGPNGVYIYTNIEALPVNPGTATNYWVDAIFSTSANPVIANAGANQTIILPTSTVTLDGSASTGTITQYNWTMISGPNTPALTTPGDVSTPVNGLEAGTYVFQLSLNGGVSTAQVTITVLPIGSSITIFTTQTPPNDLTDNDANGKGIELGVKFRSSQDGYINGVRFFKTTGNLGNHIGELYALDGTLLASAPFAPETASGWQTVNFATPVQITANTTYIAAYFSSLGNYKGTVNYFTTAVVNSPLTGLADGTDGANGVYIYTLTPAPPVNPATATNYWVDAVFSESSTPLPVQYLYFTASRQGNDAKLQWTTSQEENNKGFEVQRSADGASWTVLGFVTGAGNSQTPRSYQYIDQGLTPGTYYYRLRQVDLDGKSDISKVVRVTISGLVQMELLQNRPNPFNNSTSIILIIPKAGRISLTLYDQLGRPMRTLLDADKLPGTYTIQMNRDGLSGGIYYYKLDSRDGSTTRKMTIY